ncbi:amidohydrolase-like protein [Aureococcus anophagefferens]|nr:amidohydrolase-like protein [Aureococcus anophagefferens]
MLDVVLAHGRALDPETGLDGVRHVGIKGGRIACVVDGAAPVPEAARVALDGVTTHLELGLGCSDVGEWLRCRAGGQRLHYGVAAGFLCCRAAAFADRTNEPGSPGGPASPPPPRRSGRTTDEMMERRRSRNNSMTTTCEVVRYDPHHDEPHLSSACFCCGNASASQRSDPRTGRRALSRLDDGLRDGALGVALCLRYVPGADAEEVLRCFDAAARWGAAVFATPRAGAPGLLDRSRRTVDVTASRGPFGSDLNRLDSPVFAPGFDARLRLDDPGRVAWLATGETLTAESLERKRALVGPGKAEHGLVSVAGARGDAMLLHPPALVASGCPPVDDGGRPSERRADVLGAPRGLARDRGPLSTLEALAKMTLHPALRLEHACAAFRAKGRLQVGCSRLRRDAAVFDDRRRRVAFEGEQPRVDVAHVLVGGVFVVDGGTVVEAAAPGRALTNTLDAPGAAAAVFGFGENYAGLLDAAKADGLDTPALVMDAKAFRHNAAALSAHVRSSGCRWRPHAKALRCGALAKACVDAGAVGITCAKVSQARAVVDAGVGDVLVANEVVGEAKIAALVALGARATDASPAALRRRLVAAPRGSAAVEAAGLDVAVVSGAGSGNYVLAATLGGVTEVQAGGACFQCATYEATIGAGTGKSLQP